MTHRGNIAFTIVVIAIIVGVVLVTRNNDQDSLPSRQSSLPSERGIATPVPTPTQVRQTTPTIAPTTGSFCADLGADFDILTTTHRNWLATVYMTPALAEGVSPGPERVEWGIGHLDGLLYDANTLEQDVRYLRRHTIEEGCPEEWIRQLDEWSEDLNEIVPVLEMLRQEAIDATLAITTSTTILESRFTYDITGEFYQMGNLHMIMDAIPEYVEGAKRSVVLLHLRPEPSNRFDRNAIAVHIDNYGMPGLQIGYIPRTETQYWRGGGLVEGLITYRDRQYHPFVVRLDVLSYRMY